MLASPRREIHTPAITRLFPITRLHSPGKDGKETTTVLAVKGKKNLSFSNNLLMFSEEHADMHV